MELLNLCRVVHLIDNQTIRIIIQVIIQSMIISLNSKSILFKFANQISIHQSIRQLLHSTSQEIPSMILGWWLGASLIHSKINDLYFQLKNLPYKHAYLVTQIPGYVGFLFGVDQVQRPCLFITAHNRLIEFDLRTSHVSFHPNQTFDLTLSDNLIQSGVFHALICEFAEPSRYGDLHLSYRGFLGTGE